MKKWRERFLTYVLTDRRVPTENRVRVGQNLMLLSIFFFFIFMINFVIIIGTDKKFGVDLSEGAKQVYQRTQTVAARRGTIYDRNGNVIAEDSTTYSVYAIIDKNYVTATGEELFVKADQFGKVADIFKKYLKLEKDYVLKQLGQDGLTQVYFGVKGGNLTYSTMSNIKKAAEAAGIKGIAFETSTSRMYPNGTFASQFIGLAQTQEDKQGNKHLVGTTGLEAAFNDILSGTDGKITYQKDKNGNTLLGTGVQISKAINGKDVYTTLSEPIQRYLETQMDVFQSKAKGIQASATLVNAKTGEILATTERPTFNADTKEGLTEDFTWRSALYQTNYEPGSTLKVMTLASAIDAGVFNPNEIYNNTSLTVVDATIRDWSVNNGTSTGGYMSFAQGFAYSSNIGMTLLEQKMGEDKWLNYLAKFRFGFPTRFGMGSEATGLLPADNIVSIAMSSFGQGIAVTQTQMLRAFTAISNDGVMLEPQFISQIYDPNTDSVRRSQKEVVGNPVSKQAASQTRDYMVTVGTDPNFGTLYSKTEGPIIQANNQSVAVKSGTAEIAAEDGSGYLTGPRDYIYSVVAMVPSDNPDFIMYATIQQPQEWSELYWRDVINPVLEEAILMKDTILQPAIKSDKETAYQLPEILGESPGDTADELRRHLVHPIVLGTGSKISKVSVKAGSQLKANQQVMILTSNLENLPDMYGWTKKNVEIFAKWLGIDVSFKGSSKGKVIEQSLEAGTNISKVKKITIRLGD